VLRNLGARGGGPGIRSPTSFTEATMTFPIANHDKPGEELGDLTRSANAPSMRCAGVYLRTIASVGSIR
jgi:hypothetical protein